MLKLLKYVFVIPVGLVVSSFMVLMVSYNYTYVYITPEFTIGKFQDLRIGPISVELPAAFSYVQQVSVRLKFPEHILRLHEFKLPTPCESNLSKHSEGRSVIDAVGNRSLLYSSAVYPDYSSFSMKFYFSDGCAIVEGDIDEGNTYQEREQEFLRLVGIFFKHYLWLGDNSFAQKGFKTQFGVIKTNNDFKVIMLWSIRDGDSLKTLTANIDFEFLADPSQLATAWNFSAFDKILLHLDGRLLYNDILFGYGWNISTRQVAFLNSYIGNETMVMQASQNGIPVELFFQLNAYESSRDNCYSDGIRIELQKNPFLSKGKLTHNVFYGYWNKIFDSECMAL
jgi:hypothetical protein